MFPCGREDEGAAVPGPLPPSGGDPRRGRCRRWGRRSGAGGAGLRSARPPRELSRVASAFAQVASGRGGAIEGKPPVPPARGTNPAWGRRPRAAPEPRGEAGGGSSRAGGRPSSPRPGPPLPAPCTARHGAEGVGGGSPVTHACVEADQAAIHAFKKANPSTSGKKGHLALNSAARLVFRRRFWRSL